MLTALVAGLLAGLVSIPHCLGMCGPLAAWAAIPPGQVHSPLRPLRWQLGRLLSYTLLGGVAGGAGGRMLQLLAPSWLPLALSVALAVALLVSAVRLARRPSSPPLVSIRTSRKTPFATRILARAPREPLVLGFLTALLPCGALFTGALVAAGAGSIASGATAMAGFAVASGLPLIAAAALGQGVRAMPFGARRVLAAGLVLGALVTLARPIPSLLNEGSPSCHSAE